MKRIFTFLAALFTLSSTNFLNAQTYVYKFNNDFAETNSLAPNLDSLLTCIAPFTGTFNSQTITTSAGVCGAGAQVAYDFNEGGGVSFGNAGSQIGGVYTINLLMKFDDLTGFHRILDFSNRADDDGIYTNGTALHIFPQATVNHVAAATMTVGVFHFISLVRNSNDSVILYLDGVRSEEFLDNGTAGDLSIPTQITYVPFTATTPINFFIDDLCEDGPGSIRYLSLSTTAASDAQIANDFTSLCGTLLPVHMLDFVANKLNSAVSLSWNTQNESNASHFEVERSASGGIFTKLGEVAAANNSGNNHYSFVDKAPSSGSDFYRIKMVDMNGGFKYSSVLKIDFNGQLRFGLYPNPVTDVLTFTGMKTGGKVRFLNVDGKELIQKLSAGESMTIDISKYPAGLYYVQYSDGERTENRTVVKN